MKQLYIQFIYTFLFLTFFLFSPKNLFAQCPEKTIYVMSKIEVLNLRAKYPDCKDLSKFIQTFESRIPERTDYTKEIHFASVSESAGSNKELNISLLRSKNCGQLSIHPKSTADVVHLNDFARKQEEFKIYVLDKRGNIVKSDFDYSTTENNQIKINISDLKSGLYIVVVKNGNQYHKGSISKL